MLPSSASEHYDAQERYSDVVVAGVRRVWRRMRGQRWSDAWRRSVGPEVTRVITEGQQTAAAETAVYATAVLEQLDIPADAPNALNVDVFAGVTGAGNPIQAETFGAVIQAAKAQYEPRFEGVDLGEIERQVLEEAENLLAEIAATVMADTFRAVEVAEFARRPWVKGYVRMIEPGACSRCAVQAGRFYLFNAGFDRHPQCRCVHIPFSENLTDDPRTNPDLYFKSLTSAEQDRIFTNAGAEAIRLGADISQVVNARRGMRTAQQNPRGWIPKGRLVTVDVFGRPTYVTTEGVTKRGVARKAMGAGRPVRLMPESVMQIASSPEERVRLLRLYGYIT